MYMKCRTLCVPWVYLALICLLSSTLSAQVTGTLTGTVSDPTSAVVPGASVTLTNVASGDQRTTVTNGDGFFSINAVQPGDYKVIVKSAGFQQYEQEGIHFDPGDKRNLSNITLSVGSSTETVTVSGTVEALTPVDSGEKSVVIGQKQLQNIAIVGQNAAEFVKLLPGFALNGGNGANQGYQSQQQSTGAGPVGNFSANGSRTGAIDITSDGAHIIDPGCNCGQAVNTVTDMTAEMKVLTSNFGAENAKGPVVISAIGKSGGSQFHGEGYLYARNQAFDATNSYNNSLGTNPLTNTKYAPKPDTSFYYPGGNIGGPVLIPGTNFNKNHDKLFFFLAYEYYAQTVQDPSHDVFTSFVPTAEMRTGNYTQSYLDSYFKGTSPGSSVTGAANQNAKLNGVATPTGQIAPGSFSPIGVNMLNLYPLPNADPALNSGFNYLYSTTHTDNMWQLRPRIDWSISEKTKLFVSYNIQREMNHDNSTLWWGTSPAVPYPSPQEQPNRSDSISVNLTKVFSPTTTNELVFTYTNLYVGFHYQNPDKINADKLGINYKHIFNNTVNNQVPTITGWSDGVANIINPSGYEKNNTLYANKWLPTLADTFSKVWGTHTAKFGFYWERTKNEQPSNNYVNGQQVYANWGQASTGNAYADMLTGIMAGYTESNTDPLIAMHYMPLEFFAQDSWKVSRRLTLDYGMRFDHLSPWIDEVGHGAGVFLPSQYDPSAPGTTLTGFSWHSNNKNIPLSGTESRAFFYSPRFGLAYDIFGTGKTVLRGGFGMYRFHDEQNVQAAALRLAAGSYDYAVPNPPNNVPLTFDYLASITPGAVAPGGVRVLDLHDTEQPLTTNYSFTISQRMPWASTAEFSYVGNKAKYLNNASNGTYGNINGFGYGTLFADPSIFGTADKPNTGPVSAGASKYNPYPQYGQIYQQEHNNYSNYNSFQASWNKQTGHFNWLANYTFSKALGIRGENTANGVVDLLNINNNYGVLPNDRTHIFNVAYVYQLGELYHGNRFLRGVANGWQASGTTQYQSGSPIQANSSPNFGMGGPLAAGTVLPNGVVVPNGGNQNSFGINADVINGTPYILAMPVLTCDPRKNLKENQFINGDCFQTPTPGHNGAYVMPYLKGPAFVNSDLSLFKRFQIKESKNIEFRVSAFNFLNHAITSWNPGGGDTNLTLNMGPDGKPSSKTFGYTNYRNGNRTVQFVFKFFF
jgi:Carboxypeptidase regulatory-like domain